MSRTYLTLGLILISVLIFTVTPAFANDCDPTVDYNALGHTQYAQGEFNLAVASFTCALQAHPEAATIYNARGNAYRNLGNYVNAIADYDKAIEIDEEYAIAYNNRGWAYFKLDDEDHAIEDYTKALEIDPDLSYAYNNRGLIFQLNGKEELASADFNRALDLNLPVSWATYNLGLLQLEAAEITPVSETTAANSEAKEYVIQAYNTYNNRDFAEAVRLSTKALEIDPDYFNAHYIRGRSYIVLDQFEAALADFDRMVELRPDYVYGYWERTVAAAALGDFDQANADANHAYQMDSTHVNNFIARGVIAALSSVPIEAGQQLHHLLEAYGTEPVVGDILEIGDAITLQIERYTIYSISFLGEADQTLHITADSTDLFPVIVLLDTDGNPINGDTGSAIGSSSVINAAQLSDDGIYTLLVSHAGGGSEGEVDLTITLEQ